MVLRLQQLVQSSFPLIRSEINSTLNECCSDWEAWRWRLTDNWKEKNMQVCFWSPFRFFYSQNSICYFKNFLERERRKESTSHYGVNWMHCVTYSERMPAHKNWIKIYFIFLQAMNDFNVFLFLDTNRQRKCDGNHDESKVQQQKLRSLLSNGTLD